MADVVPEASFGDRVVPSADATLSITSAAVLYGLSVSTVLPVTVTRDGQASAFRLGHHHGLLGRCVRIIGSDTLDPSGTRSASSAELFDRGRRGAPRTPVSPDRCV